MAVESAMLKLEKGRGHVCEERRHSSLLWKTASSVSELM
jgi:hypothetical protein